jgi:hypothetical protein
VLPHEYFESTKSQHQLFFKSVLGETKSQLEVKKYLLVPRELQVNSVNPGKLAPMEHSSRLETGSLI